MRIRIRTLPFDSFNMKNTLFLRTILVPPRSFNSIYSNNRVDKLNSMEPIEFPNQSRVSFHGEVNMTGTEDFTITLPNNSGKYQVDITPLS